ncbi:hypothetical protein [Haloarcula sp. CBA1127]|uniref:hypothetical protein n=1 Tax=Haloarcula sp. CBA1127 TaxID=1765055 RepID=UPI00073F69F3|nr:hypothetical protein [Haloarcula sp. CBA1127]
MEDYDWIEIAYTFDTVPSLAVYKSLFRELPQHLDETNRSDEIEVVYWDRDDERMEESVEYKRVAQIAIEYPTIKVKLETGWEDISIAFEKQGLGFPLYESTPYLEFTTWIYALQNPDDEHADRVKKSRRWGC